MPAPIILRAVVSTKPTRHPINAVQTFDVTLLPLTDPPTTLHVRAGVDHGPVELGDRWSVILAPRDA